VKGKLSLSGAAAVQIGYGEAGIAPEAAMYSLRWRREWLADAA